MEPEGYDVAHGVMHKMARDFIDANEDSDDGLQEELDQLVYNKGYVKVSQKEALEAQANAHDSDGEFEVEDYSEEVEELSDGDEDENVKTEQKKSYTDKMQTYDSDDNDIMAELHKIEAQDNNFKSKIMKQNKHDEQKAEIVKEQKRVLELILGQRMSIQGYFNKVNQLPQHENFYKFKEDKSELFEDVENAVKASLVNLNDICSLLAKRLNANLSSFSEDDDTLKCIDKNYNKIMPI